MADIRLDSRYAKAQLKRDRNNVEYVDWFGDIKFDIEQFEDNQEHECVDGDTVFSLASKYLGSMRYYWVICRSNTIFNPFEKLERGKKLLIPSEKTFRTEIIGQR